MCKVRFFVKSIAFPFCCHNFPMVILEIPFHRGLKSCYSIYLGKKGTKSESIFPSQLRFMTTTLWNSFNFPTKDQVWKCTLTEIFTCWSNPHIFIPACSIFMEFHNRKSPFSFLRPYKKIGEIMCFWIPYKLKMFRNISSPLVKVKGKVHRVSFQ